LIPLVLAVIVIAVVAYIGFNAFQDPHIIADFRVYRPLYGSSGLTFTSAEIKTGISFQKINEIKNWFTFRSSYVPGVAPGEAVHVEMYRDGVRCQSIHGTCTLGNEISGILSCPVTQNMQEITLKLIDHTGTIKEEKTFNL